MKNVKIRNIFGFYSNQRIWIKPLSLYCEYGKIGQYLIIKQFFKPINKPVFIRFYFLML